MPSRRCRSTAPWHHARDRAAKITLPGAHNTDLDTARCGPLASPPGKHRTLRVSASDPSPKKLDAQCELAPPFPPRSAINEVAGCLPGFAIVDLTELGSNLSSTPRVTQDLLEEDRGYEKLASYHQETDAINEGEPWHRPQLATSHSAVSPTLGCADNHLAALRRQYFYLAITPSALCYSLNLPHLATTASTDPRGTQKIDRPARIQATNSSVSAVHEFAQIPMTMEQNLCIGTTRKRSRKTLQLQAKFRSARVHFFDGNGDVSQAVQPRSPLDVRPVEGALTLACDMQNRISVRHERAPTRRVGARYLT